MTPLEKKTLRHTLKTLRKNVPLIEQTAASQTICNTIQSLCEFQEAKRVAFYHAVNGEVNLDPLIDVAYSLQKICYFPVLNSMNQLSFFSVSKDEPLVPNRFEILEPLARANPTPPNRLDLLLMPLVGFDETGARLGMGGGYYDKTLAMIKPPLLIGVAYEFQRQPHIPTDEHDIFLSLIVTEKKLYRSPR